MIRHLWAAAILTIVSLWHTAMAQEVGPVDSYLVEFKGRYQIGVDDIRQQPIPLEQKIARYQKFLADLKADFRTRRSQEYEAVQRTAGVAHSCTKGTSGGTKKCGSKCAAAGDEFYTRADWSQMYDNTSGGRPISGDDIRDDGAKSCVYLQRSGKGKTKRRVVATFRYRPNIVADLVLSEETDLFVQIASGEPFP